MLNYTKQEYAEYELNNLSTRNSPKYRKRKDVKQMEKKQTKEKQGKKKGFKSFLAARQISSGRTPKI